MSHIENIDLPTDAGNLLDQAAEHNFDNSKILSFRLKGVEPQDLQELCEKATESYARKALNWPNGRLEKPEIFDRVNGQQDDINACVRHFIDHFGELLGSDAPYELPVYYKAFVVASKENFPERAALVLLHNPDGEGWRADSVECPVEEELGLTVTSLTMGDESPEDTLQRLGQD